MTRQTTVEPGVRCVASVTADRASRYLQQLAKHFRHKLPVVFDRESGQITFPLGECRMDAAGGVLNLELVSPDVAQLEKLQEVVARHLLRFAFREDLQIAWQPA